MADRSRVPGSYRTYDTQGYASYQSSGSPGMTGATRGTPSGDFSRLIQIFTDNIQKMVTNVSQMDKLIGLIGTSGDNFELRQTVKKQQNETHLLAKSCGQIMKDLSHIPAAPTPVEQRARKLQKERLIDEFTTALKNFQFLQRKLKDKENEAIGHARNRPSPMEEEELDNDQLFGIGTTAKQMTVMKEDTDMELLRDREKAVQQLECDIMDVNQIFKDLSILVHEQGEVIDSIEANVESTSLNVSRGTEQLQQARNYRAKIRERKCCLLIIVLVVVVILAIIIGVSVSHRS